ncbi:hypothetical protein [Methanobacterium sp. ACI-7]|uniref:hypothetical protein n=1 Tax=unclassified Methanobacterium TaxID=2627676 RepID=UPI0039C3CC72
MDENGFIFTMDAVLMLIPIFIIAATVSGLSLSVPHESPYYQTEDVMETLYNIGNGPKDVSLYTLANNITNGTSISTVKGYATDPKFKIILDKSGRKYSLTYYNNATGTYDALVNNTNIANLNNIASTTRTYNGVIFRLYMW